MKKFLFSVALLMGGMAVASAQSITPVISGNVSELYILPKAISYDGQKFYAGTGEWDHWGDGYTSYSILDDNFNVAHEIVFTTDSLQEYSVVESRTMEIVPTDTSVYDNSYSVLDYLSYNKGMSLSENYKLTIDDCNNYFDYYNYYDIDSTYTENGRTYFVREYYTYYDYEIYERVYTKYPTEYYCLEDGKLYEVRMDYGTRYTGAWNEPEKRDLRNVPEKRMEFAALMDADADIPASSYDMDLAFTQTLFNNDEKYELLVDKYVVKAGKPNEQDRDGDGEIDYRETNYQTVCDSWEIVSEDGTTLFSQKVEDGYSMDFVIYKFKGSFYLFDENQLYRIDKESSSLQKVAMPAGMKMFPTLARPSDEITIEFEPSVNNAVRTLSVSDAAGRTVEQRTVAPEETCVTVSARRFHAGTYIFTLTENGKQVDNGKIIVK